MSDEAEDVEVGEEEEGAYYEPTPVILVDGDVAILDPIQFAAKARALATRVFGSKLQVLTEDFEWKDATDLRKKAVVRSIK